MPSVNAECCRHFSKIAIAPHPIIEFRKVCKAFAKPSGKLLSVLGDIDLTIHEGEILGLVGRSGSGKSTVLINAQGAILEANPQAEQLFGYTRTELSGLQIEALLPERFRQGHSEHRRNYMRNPHIRPMGAGLELYAVRKDGTEFPVDVMLSPVQLGENCVVAVVRDVTKWKSIQTELRKSEEKFRLLVEGARDYAIFMLDLQGQVATWNPGAERIKGYKEVEIIGRHFSIFYTQEDIDRRKPQHELETVQREGRCEDEGWRLRKDGSRFWADVIITALYDNNQELIGYSKVTCDLSNRKKAEDALLLELSSTLLARQDIAEMLSAIARSIQQVQPCNYANIALFDPAMNQLRVHGLFTNTGSRKKKRYSSPSTSRRPGGPSRTRSLYLRIQLSPWISPENT